jgi:hypothetical protein
MTATGGDPPSLTDFDVDGLAWQFLNSDYVSDMYLRSSLDERLGNFLRRRGLVRVAYDGDRYNLILERVMTGISSVPRTANRSRATVRPTRQGNPRP